MVAILEIVGFQKGIETEQLLQTIRVPLEDNELGKGYFNKEELRLLTSMQRQLVFNFCRLSTSDAEIAYYELDNEQVKKIRSAL